MFFLFIPKIASKQCLVCRHITDDGSLPVSVKLMLLETYQKSHVFAHMFETKTSNIKIVIPNSLLNKKLNRNIADVERIDENLYFIPTNRIQKNKNNCIVMLKVVFARIMLSPWQTLLSVKCCKNRMGFKIVMIRNGNLCSSVTPFYKQTLSKA